MKPRTGQITWISYPAPGHYRARITLPDGSRPVIHLPEDLSEPKAREMAAALTEQAWADNASQVKGRPATTVVSTLWDKWLTLLDSEDLAPSTVAAHNSNGVRILARFGKLRMEQVTKGLMRQWIREMKAEDLSPSRINNIFNTTGKFIDTAIDEEWVVMVNPCRSKGVRSLLPEVTVDSIVTLDDARIERLLASPRRLRYLVALTSGLRDGEISALKWGDIRVEQGVLIYDVHHNFAIYGENGKVGLSDTKTRAGVRLVPVHPAVEALIRSQCSWPRVELDAPVFPGRHGGHSRPDSAPLLRRDLGEEDSSWDFRTLRRNFSTALDRAGISDGLKDRLMGHAPKSVRQRHYTAPDLQRMFQAVQQIPVPGWVSAPDSALQMTTQVSETLIPESFPGATFET